MLIGEEKISEAKENKALKQVIDFLGNDTTIPTKVFGNIPFIFAYTACGQTVKLFCFTRDKTQHSFQEFDINSIFGRISLFIHMVNVARIVKAFGEFLTSWPYDEYLYKPSDRPLGSCVTLCYGGVYKIYKKGSLKYVDAERIYEIYSFVKKQIYESFPAIRCLEIVKPKQSTKNQEYLIDVFEICLAPLCAKVNKYAVFFKDLLCALKSVILVLIVLHDNGLVHGDIRWGNVMYSIDDTRFLVIDFDNGGQSGRLLTNDDIINGYPEQEMLQG
jgi:serine/threonine protein kinase